MKAREDILGTIPEIGDIIVYNPPRYKGIVHRNCIGFQKSGLPIVKVKYAEEDDMDEAYFEETPKTGFVVIKKQ